MGWLVVILLFALILKGMPIGFALMLAPAIAMLVSGIDLVMAPIRLFSGVNKVVLLAIPLFIFMGELMGATSISDRIIHLARALVGWIRGGLAHVNVMTSMFMAEMSGSAVADATVMSKIFVPSMEQRGYPRTFAATVTATSATLGIIIPPSIPMVLYGVTTNSSIKDLFIAGIVPGILLGSAFMVTSYIFARREGHPVDERFEWSMLARALLRAAVPPGDSGFCRRRTNRRLGHTDRSGCGGCAGGTCFRLGTAARSEPAAGLFTGHCNRQADFGGSDDYCRIGRARPVPGQ